MKSVMRHEARQVPSWLIFDVRQNMKPWRPYWKHLEEIEDVLLKDAGPTPFGPLSAASSWIGKLPFIQLVSCDLIFRGMIENLKYGLERVPHQTFEGADIRWQMILRVACGLSFCQGRVFKRKNFDWNQPSEGVYKWLLIELWYHDAMHWAHCSFGSDSSKKSRLAYDLRTDLWQLPRPKRIERN